MSYPGPHSNFTPGQQNSSNLPPENGNAHLPSETLDADDSAQSTGPEIVFISGKKLYELPPSAPSAIGGYNNKLGNDMSSAPSEIEGTNNNSYSLGVLPPPALNEEESKSDVTLETQPLPNFTELTPEQIREAVLEYAGERCCYGKRPARNMIIQGMKLTGALHYTVETFCERRETSWANVPYSGFSSVDGPENGPAPDAWDIPVEPLAFFQESEERVEVPHTASVKVCYRCRGKGTEMCMFCTGLGRESCISCGGSGRTYGANGSQFCYACSGLGRRTCLACSGRGEVTCRMCIGDGKLKFYVELVVTWTNYSDKYIYEETDLPDELISDVKGETVFVEEMPRVRPVSHFPNDSVNEASKSLLEKHATSHPMERILQQRHYIRVIPVTTVSYSYKDKRAEFFVYGLEGKVYFPDYPARCCWGCQIL